jgi:hypothetical protein
MCETILNEMQATVKSNGMEKFTAGVHKLFQYPGAISKF